MKITIESTNQIVKDRGRVWKGVTEGGVPCLVLVYSIGSESDEALAALQAELASLDERGKEALLVLQVDKDREPDPTGSN